MCECRVCQNCKNNIILKNIVYEYGYNINNSNSCISIDRNRVIDTPFTPKKM